MTDLSLIRNFLDHRPLSTWQEQPWPNRPELMALRRG